jgi:hypothetical protein
MHSSQNIESVRMSNKSTDTNEITEQNMNYSLEYSSSHKHLQCFTT